MSTESNSKEYIVLFPHKDGYKPAAFSDGTVAIYGDIDEAKSDAGRDGVVAEVKINKD